MNNLDCQSLFNIVFCYFPITFRPPPNDPYGISTDDLRLALRYVWSHLIICSFIPSLTIRQSGALNATPTFGPLAIPVFLDKLTAGSRATKVNLNVLFAPAWYWNRSQIDTLQALSASLPVYGSALARASARKLWNALKLEVSVMEFHRVYILGNIRYFSRWMFRLRSKPL